MIESTCSVVDVSTMLPIFTGETGRCLTIVREYNRWYCMYLNKPIKPLKYFAMNFHSVYNALQNYGRRADYNLSTAELNPDKGYWVALELPGKIYNKPSTI